MDKSLLMALIRFSKSETADKQARFRKISKFVSVQNGLEIGKNSCFRRYKELKHQSRDELVTNSAGNSVPAANFVQLPEKPFKPPSTVNNDPYDEYPEEKIGQPIVSSEPRECTVITVPILHENPCPTELQVAVEKPTIQAVYTNRNISVAEKIKFRNALMGPNKPFPQSWTSFGFEFSNNSWRLLQREGGPCALLACVQAALIQKLMEKGHNFLSPVSTINQPELLSQATSGLLWNIAASCRFPVVVEAGLLFSVPVSASFPLDSVHLTHFTKPFNSSVNSTNPTRSIFLFLLSALLTGQVLSESSEPNPLSFIDTSYGYGSQELVNLILTGKAVSNVFDDTMMVDGVCMNGISLIKPPIGFLTLNEALGHLSVGSYYKNPQYPIWVVYSQSHYTVLFQINDDNNDDVELMYYDGLEWRNDDFPIRLTIKRLKPSLSRNYNKRDDRFDPPIERIIKTKWGKDIAIDWHGVDPIL